MQSQSQRKANNPMNIQKFVDRGFRNGAVLRVSMLNFLTYDRCEVFPGPLLNVILGPNGTGKSTITHAICLACTGKPEQVGRSSEIKQFVKRDKQDSECYVEIDLLDIDARRVQTVNRRINSVNESSVWHLNGERCTETKVSELMAYLSIDVKNLCSFMPQDKVGQFSTHSPEQILQETLKCVRSSEADKTLFQEQEELSKFDSDKVEKERDLLAKVNNIETMKTQLRDLKDGVERMQERGRAETKLEHYKIRKVVIEAEAQDEKINEKKVRVEEVELAKSEIEKRIAPLEAAEREIKKQVLVFDKSISAKKEKIHDVETKIYNSGQEIEDKNREMTERLGEINNAITTRNKIEMTLAREKESLRTTKEEFQIAQESEASNKVKLAELSKASQKLNDEESAIEEDSRAIDNRLQQCNRKIDAINRDARNLQDSRQKFKQRLNQGNFGANLNACAAHSVLLMDWIDQNQQKLKAQIFGPMGMYINSSDQTIVDIFEKAIAQKDIVNGFCCQNEQDAKLLKDLARAKEWKIFIVTIDGGSPDMAYTPQEMERFKRDHNVVGYLVEQLENCPEPVRKYFLNFQGLFGTLVQKCTPAKPTFNLVKFGEEVLVGHHMICKIYSVDLPSAKDGSNITEYTLRKSRYSGTSSTQSGKATKAKILSVGGNADDEALRASIESHRATELATKRDLEEQSNRIKQQADVVRKKSDGLMRERTNLSKLLNSSKELENKMKIILRRVGEHESQLSRNIETEKAQIMKQYVKVAGEYQQLMSESLKWSKDLMQLEISVKILELKKRAFLKQKNADTNELNHLKMELAEKDDELRDRKKELKDLENLRKNLLDQLAMVEQEKGGEAAFNKLYREIVSTCPEQTLDEVLDKIAYYREILRSTIEDSSIIGRFKALNIELKLREAEYKALHDSVDNLENELEMRSMRWKTEVDQTCNKINELFQKFMGDIGYEGEAVIIKDERFIKWRMDLKVNFKEYTTMKTLSGTCHSGGERAVSTITYLMAMQGLTASPWRIVDEINQGMDNDNERKVLEVMSDCCAPTSMVELTLAHTEKANKSAKSNGKDGPPQYFLVSPKLLQGLRCLDRDDVTFLIVCNGPGVHLREWDMDAMILELEKRTNSAHMDL